MSDFVIRAEGLGKKYVIGHQSAERYMAVRDVIGRSIKALARSAVDMMRGRQIIAGDEVEEFWALKDVSFEIKRGEVVGIIGRNGAGKSTLLKILSRITEPSTGRIEIKGRVSSLLEVGTGFHPELTGRENIYLNGAILGMSRAEIRRKFDEIVAFAEVEKFLDTPVKRYSSGMYVRLAFAVAAHLEPEILVVDEVLAVGDAAFQKKCLGKMQDVAGCGRTVLLVTHNLSVAEELATMGLLLANGQVQQAGRAEDVVRTYMKRVDAKSAPAFFKNSICAMSIEILNSNYDAPFGKHEKIDLKIAVEVKQPLPDFHAGYAIYQKQQIKPLWWSFFGDVGGTIGVRAGVTRWVTSIPSHWLNDGEYELEPIAALHGQEWIAEPDSGQERIAFSVSGGKMGNAHVSATTRPGALFPILTWERVE